MDLPNSEPETIALAHRFMHHPATDRQVMISHALIRQVMFDAAMRVMATVPEGRERSLAITKLEEAMMWANAGIARAQDKQPGEDAKLPRDLRR